MKANKVFDAIKATLVEWNRECEEYEATKAAKAEELDEEGYWDWLTSHDKPECPVKGGRFKAYRIWCWNDAEELNVNDTIWESEVAEFVSTLREAGVKTFTYTDESTALMRNMHGFVANGCTLLGLCEVELADPWMRKGNGARKGVRFAV